MSTNVRIGLIGFGNWVRTSYVPILKTVEGVDVVAVSARSAASQQAAAQMLGGDVKPYADWRDMLADDAIDAVMIALPAALHAQVTSAAAKTGKHVFFEPPLGRDRAECDSVMAALEQSSRVIQCDLELRYVPAVREARRLLDTGAFGDVLMAKITHWCDWSKTFGAEAGDEGFFLWLGCWYLDTLDVVFGEAPTRAHVAGGYHVSEHLFDYGYAALGYPNGLGVYELNLVAAAGTVIELHITATGGEIAVDIANGLCRHRNTGEDAWQQVEAPAIQPAHGFVGMAESIRDFFDAIRDGRAPIANLDVIQRVHEAALLCTEAAPKI